MKRYTYYIIALFLTILGFFNVYRKITYKEVWDGIIWDKGKNGIYCKKNLKDLFHPRIKNGDILLEAEGEIVSSKEELLEILLSKKPNEPITYYLVREGNFFYSSAKLTTKGTPPLYYYLVLIGFSTLFISLYIVLQKGEKSLTSETLFFLLGVSFFSIYVFSPTMKFDFWDRVFFTIDKAGFLFFPILLIKFFLEFPVKSSTKLNKPLKYFLLLSGIITIFYVTFISGVFPKFSEIFSTVEKYFSVFSLIYFSLGFITGIAILIFKIMIADDIFIKNQIKWIIGGILAGFLPFFFFYVIPYYKDPFPPDWAQFMVLFQLIIPLSFAYAISGYKLMDFEVVTKKFLVNTTGFFIILTIYLNLLKLFTPSFKGKFTIIAVSMIVGFLALAPFFDILERLANKLFYRKSYSYRQDLIEFSNIVTFRRNLLDIVDNFLTIFISALLLKKAAIYLYDKDSDSFILVRSKGGDDKTNYINVLRFSENIKKTILSEPFIWFYNFSTLSGKDFLNSDIKLLKTIDAYHIVPLKYENRLRGIIVADRKLNGTYLTSEDWSLLLAILPSITLAIENANLYETLKNKIKEINSLKEFNESIIENVKLGIMVVDKNDLIRQWNSFLESLFGLSKKTVLNKEISYVLGRSIKYKLKDIKDKEFVRAIIKDSKSRKRTLEISKYSFTIEETFHIFIFNDITEKLRIERELITKEKLASVGFLTAGIAHEINTPLTGIKSYCQFLKKSVENSENLKLIEEIEKQADRMKILITSLLNFSREGKGVKTEFKIRDSIKESLAIIDYYIKKKRIKININGSNPTIFADRTKITQVFLNLIKNSIDASKEDSLIELSIREHNDFIEISIIDQGEGISKDNLPYIFDPFFTTKGIGKGTGLGLSIVYSIIKEHGGDIEVESKVGVGTKFTIKFPL